MPTNEETLGYHSPIIPGMDQEGEARHRVRPR